MSLDLDIKIENGINLKDILINSRTELIKLTKCESIPEIQGYLLKQGIKYVPDDEYILRNSDMVVINLRNSNDEVSLVITELAFCPPYIMWDKAGLWAGISVQNVNNQKLLLAASIALYLSRLCGSNILDERMVWSNQRENTYDAFFDNSKIKQLRDANRDSKDSNIVIEGEN